LADLVAKHDLDVICLQETKLQELHLDDPKLKLRGHLLEEEGYDAYYSCSTEKKGYSGTAVFIKRRGNVGKKQKTLDSFLGSAKAGKAKDNQASAIAKLVTPFTVSLEMGNAKHDNEGRIIVVDFPLFSLCNVYVPNSGQDLKRLQYRTEEWDSDFLMFMEQRQKERGVPVMWLGDLNVAHTHLEVWNDGAKHLPKQAGVTPEERASFQKMLDSGWIDAFRQLHPTANGMQTKCHTRMLIVGHGLLTRPYPLLQVTIAIGHSELEIVSRTKVCAWIILSAIPLSSTRPLM
jgi:exonuclease III